MIRRAATTAAAGFYLANCALGIAVATGRVDTSGYRWVHHALYVCTLSLTVASLGLAARARRPQEAVPLAGAVVPLAMIPFVGTHGRRHPATASTAAPFYAAALIGTWRR